MPEAATDCPALSVSAEYLDTAPSTTSYTALFPRQASHRSKKDLRRTDGRRPDGLTMIPWRAGRHLVWDATVVDTLAPSYVQASATMAGSAAEIATERKNSKYSELLSTHFFVPIALETLGPINIAGHNFLSELV